jgi:hypothetical protein
MARKAIRPSRKLTEDERQRAYEKELEELRRYTPRSHASADQIRAEFEELEMELEARRDQAVIDEFLSDFS